MNGLDMLNTTPSGSVAGQAAAARADDAAPDDPGGDATRSFNDLLSSFAEPAATAVDGSPHPAAPAPPPVVLRQTMMMPEPVPGNTPATAVDLAAHAIEGASAHGKASQASDEMALTDLAGDSKAPTAASGPDASSPLQVPSPWSAAIGGAVGIVMPALVGTAAVSTTPVPLRPSDTSARNGQQGAAASTDGLSADVGRLLDAAAGAAEAVLSDGAPAQRGTDLVLNANVTVLRTETHLPPVTPTPLHQIVTAITAEGLDAAKADPASTEAATPPGPERQLVRTLDIRLEPPDLGSVTVKLRLTGQHLALRISADSATTAQSLDQDRDTLVSMLRGNGYTPEISAVRHEPAAAVPAASGTDAAAPGQSAANQSGGQNAADGGARSQGGQPGGQQQPSHPGFAAGFESSEGHDADVQDTAARSGVYL